MGTKGQIKDAVEEWEVVGVGPVHQRRRVHQLDGSDVGESHLGQGHGLVAGAGGDAEDFGVVVKKAEGPEEGAVGGDLRLPGVGGPEAVVHVVEGGEAAGRGVAGGSGEGDRRWGMDRDAGAGVGVLEEEEEDGERGYGYGGVGDPVQEYLYVLFH